MPWTRPWPSPASVSPLWPGLPSSQAHGVAGRLWFLGGAGDPTWTGVLGCAGTSSREGTVGVASSGAEAKTAPGHPGGGAVLSGPSEAGVGQGPSSQVLGREGTSRVAFPFWLQSVPLLVQENPGDRRQ